LNLTKKQLQIADLQPASEINGIDDFVWNIGFPQGDIVYIYQEHDGFVIVDDLCNLTMELVVKYNGTEKYNNVTYETNPENIGHKWWFTTDNTWEPGLYYVTLTLTDNNAEETVTKNILFRINEL